MISMATVTIKPTSHLEGRIHTPPSKSYTHRSLVAASLSSEVSTIENPLECDDTIATLKGIQALGSQVKIQDDQWLVRGRAPPTKASAPIECFESGTTLRLLLPVSCLADPGTKLRMSSVLSQRPIESLITALGQLGARAERSGNEIVVRAVLRGGQASIPGDISSQFLSGLLFACPLAKERTSIELTTDLESRDYVRMTLRTLEKHGVRTIINEDFRKFEVSNGSTYHAVHELIPSDFSAASFLLAAATTTRSTIGIVGNWDDLQPDRIILDLLAKMGIRVDQKDGILETQGEEIHGCEFDARQNPDVVPAAVAIAAHAKGQTIIRGVKRLRSKESNRVEALQSEFSKMGVRIETSDDEMVVHSSENDVKGARVRSWGDHRIAMALAVTALAAKGPTLIDGAECVSKSYPNFFKDLNKLGVEIEWETVQ